MLIVEHRILGSRNAIAEIVCGSGDGVRRPVLFASFPQTPRVHIRRNLLYYWTKHHHSRGSI